MIESPRTKREIARLTKRKEEAMGTARFALKGLFNAFNENDKTFYGVVKKDAKQSGNYRDSSIVLTEIDSVHTIIPDLFNHLTREHNSNVKDHRRLSFNIYQEQRFKAVLDSMLGKSSVDVLGQRDDDKDPQPLHNRDALTSAIILRFLNLSGARKMHCDLYLDSLEYVLYALTRFNGPHYAFGGASLMRVEGHAFISFACLRGLGGVAQALFDAGAAYGKIASILTAISSWSTSPDNNLQYKSKDEFLQSIVTHLPKESVGYDEALKTIVNSIIAVCSSPSIDSETKLASQITRAIQNDALPLFRCFEQKLKDRVKDLMQSERSNGGRLSIDSSSASIMPDTRIYFENAGSARVRLFFVTARDVLSDICRLCDNALTSTDGLPSLAHALSDVSARWDSASNKCQSFISSFSAWGLSQLHHQLSLYSLPGHSNFDATQLAFAIRICHEWQRSDTKELQILGLKVLFEAQQADGTWRSGKPILYYETYAAVHIASIEVALAVMPVIEKCSLVREYIQNLDAVYQWLATNKTIVAEEDVERFYGWSSDKINECGRIDVWMTALGLHFLASYSSLLSGEIFSRIIVNKYDVSSHTILLRYVPDPQMQEKLASRITTEIQDQFVKPFAEAGSNTASSMLLYGPPGTAKSTIAAAIAASLGWRLLTITPSDFVKDGIEQSESWARQIFSDFNHLTKCVILFDEIDEMLRDRADAVERPQGIAMLQFIVPGMLPKLQQLKKYGETNKIVFIIATNYRERLDPAITRPGRIDREFLVLPPDEKSRNYILLEQLRRQHLPNIQETLADIATLLARHSQGWVYKEMQVLVDTLTRRVLVEVDPKELKDAIAANQFAALVAKRTGEGLVTGSKDPKVFLAEGWTILGFSRQLNPVTFYRGRRQALKELTKVLNICCPNGKLPISAQRIVAKPK